MVIKGFRVGPLLKKTFREIGDDRVPTLAASAAYNFFFSLFPLLLFLAPLLSLVGDKQQMIGLLMAQLTSVLPPDAGRRRFGRSSRRSCSRRARRD